MGVGMWEEPDRWIFAALMERTAATVYQGSKCGGMEVFEARGLPVLEAGDTQQKRWVSDRTLDQETLRDGLTK